MGWGRWAGAGWRWWRQGQRHDAAAVAGRGNRAAVAAVVDGGCGKKGKMSGIGARNKISSRKWLWCGVASLMCVRSLSVLTSPDRETDQPHAWPVSHAMEQAGLQYFLSFLAGWQPHQGSTTDPARPHQLTVLRPGSDPCNRQVPALHCVSRNNPVSTRACTCQCRQWPGITLLLPRVQRIRAPSSPKSSVTCGPPMPRRHVRPQGVHKCPRPAAISPHKTA